MVDNKVEVMEEHLTKEDISNQVEIQLMGVMVSRTMVMGKKKVVNLVYKLVVQHAQLLYAAAVFVIF